MLARFTARDDALYHEIAKAEGCKPISAAIRLCAIDVIIILASVGVACFIWLIIWGIPLCIRGYKWFKRRQRANRLRKQLVANADKEKGPETPSPSESFMDPFLSPGWKLHAYLQENGDLATPKPAHMTEGRITQTSNEKNGDLDKSNFSPPFEQFPRSCDLPQSVSLNSFDAGTVHHSSSDLIFVDESSLVHSHGPVDSLLSTPPPAYNGQIRDSFNPYLW